VIALRVIKSRKMKWSGHVACMGDRRVQDFGGGPEGKKDDLSDLSADRRVILKWIFGT
jgi:hypothetical protein